MSDETEEERVSRLVLLAREKGFLMYPGRRPFEDVPLGVYTLTSMGLLFTATANQPRGTAFAAFSDLDQLENFLNGQDPEDPANRIN
jgi:hypothetical protein